VTQGRLLFRVDRIFFLMMCEKGRIRVADRIHGDLLDKGVRNLVKMIRTQRKIKANKYFYTLKKVNIFGKMFVKIYT